ncbi:MAG: hypothetical protein MUF15_03675 [Acidobacteria bacterium]|nr:hypothetical protein [Acidobacteriota bacterium]
MQKKIETGSMLVLTIISVLVLSIIVMGLLTVGTTETQTTQNFHLNKAAYYTAMEGVEEIRNLIVDNPDSRAIETITKSISETTKVESFDAGISDRQFKNLGITRSYVTGDLKDFHDGAPQPLEQYKGFLAPNAQGYGLGMGKDRMPLMMWEVHITAEAAMGNRRGYSEVIASVLSTAPASY